MPEETLTPAQRKFKQASQNRVSGTILTNDEFRYWCDGYLEALYGFNQEAAAEEIEKFRISHTMTNGQWIEDVEIPEPWIYGSLVIKFSTDPENPVMVSLRKGDKVYHASFHCALQEEEILGHSLLSTEVKFLQEHQEQAIEWYDRFHKAG